MFAIFSEFSLSFLAFSMFHRFLDVFEFLQIVSEFSQKSEPRELQK